MIKTFRGRGIFYIFVGTLCIRGSQPWQFIIAGILIFVGIVYIGCSFKKQEKEAGKDSLVDDSTNEKL